MRAPQLTIRIGRIAVVGASGLDARRLADALPRSLERALAETPAVPARLRRTGPADRAAREIVARVSFELEPKT